MADGIVQVAPNSSGAKIDTSELIVGANTVERQRIVLADPTNPSALALVSATGDLSVATASSLLFTDPFDGGTVDVTNRWTIQLGGAGAVTQANGKLNLDSGTTALGYAAIYSKQTFAPKGVSFDILGFSVAIEASPLTNLTRFWGKGSVPGTPTVAVPITDGFGFQIDNNTISAVVYANGTKISSQALTMPGDTSGHNYSIVFRGDTMLFIQNTSATPVAVFTTPPNVQTLPIAMVAVAGATGPSAGQVMAMTAVALGDSGKNANQLSDGAMPWVQATVKRASTAPVSTDTALVTARHPLDGITSNSGTITTQNLVPAGAATAGSAVAVTLNGANTLGVQVTGTYTGALSLQGTMDGVNWVTVGGIPFINLNTGGSLATIPSALQSIFQADVGGFVQARITGLAAMTGTATVTLQAVQAASMMALDAALPAGANTIGAVNIAAAQTLATLTTCATVTTLANGQTAHSSASTGSPLRVAGRVNTAADTTLVAGDVSDLFMTSGGAAVVKPFSVPEIDWTYAAAASGILNTTTAVTFKAAAAAGLRNYITGIDISTDGALGAATEVAIRDGAAGTVLWRMKIGTAGLQGGRTIEFPTPLRGTAATLLEVVTLTATTTGAVYVNAQGYVAP